MKNLIEKSHFSQKIMKMGLLFQLPIHVSIFMSELLTFCFVIQIIGSPCIATHLTCLIINKRQLDFEKACEMGWIGKACHDVGR